MVARCFMTQFPVVTVEPLLVAQMIALIAFREVVTYPSMIVFYRFIVDRAGQF
jgi:hypothetical protein